MGWVGQDRFRVVIESPALVQLLGSNLLETVSMGQDRFRVVVESPALVQLLGRDLCDLLETVSMGWVGLRFKVLFDQDMNQYIN